MRFAFLALHRLSPRRDKRRVLLMFRSVSTALLLLPAGISSLPPLTTARDPLPVVGRRCQARARSRCQHIFYGGGGGFFFKEVSPPFSFCMDIFTRRVIKTQNTRENKAQFIYLCFAPVALEEGQASFFSSCWHSWRIKICMFLFCSLGIVLWL